MFPLQSQIRRMCAPLGLLLTVTVLAVSPLGAQGKCSLQVLPGYAFSTYREHVGDRFSFRDDMAEAAYIHERYGVSYKPIYARGGSSLSGVVGMECRNPENYGVWGIRISSSATSFQTNGVISTNMEKEDAAGVRMWDHTLFPVRNQRTSSELSDAGYWVSARVSPWTADVYRLVNLLATEAFSLSFGGGLRAGGTRIYREEGQTQTAFVANYYTTGKHFENTITITSKAETSVPFVVGPQLSTRLQLNRGKANLTFDASFAFLMGSVREAAFWHDVDDFHVISGDDGATLVDEGRITLLDGFFPYETSHWTTLSTKDLSLSLSYPLGKRISLAPTVVYSGWGNLSAPPRWSVPGAWTLAEGSGWREQSPGRTSTLSLLAGLSIKF